MEFAVRTLPLPTHVEGAFRVHILQEHLDQVGLKLGDLCEISTDEAGKEVLGHGISWRATDKLGASQKVRPARVTNTLQAACEIREGSHVYLRRTNAKMVHAAQVTLVDVTPQAYSKTQEIETEDGRWRLHCIAALRKIPTTIDNIT